MMHNNFLKLFCILLCALVLPLSASSCSLKEAEATLTSERSQQTEPVEESAATETTSQTTSEKESVEETSPQESISLEVREVSFITEDNIKIAEDLTKHKIHDKINIIRPFAPRRIR